jgi:hypothetical protein
VVVKIKYNEPRLNQHNGNIVRRDSRDWANEFIVWINFQDLTFNNIRIVIKLDIILMNVHLLKIMWGKDLLNIFKIWS